jgi:hypothetical protein
MITEQHIKELISFRFVEVIANFKGYKTSTQNSPDYGTDMSVCEVGARDDNGQIRYSDTGRELKLQCKATTENSITLLKDDLIGYDLEAKTYNDLVQRKINQKPLLLILYILPNDKSDWI